MKDRLGLSTMEVMNQLGLSRHRFSRIVKEFKISPLKRVRGDISFRWSEDQVKMIDDLAKIVYKPEKVITELEVIEYYLYFDSNVNRIAKHFNITHNKVYRVITKYEKDKCIIVESKIKEYDG